MADLRTPLVLGDCREFGEHLAMRRVDEATGNVGDELVVREQISGRQRSVMLVIAGVMMAVHVNAVRR